MSNKAVTQTTDPEHTVEFDGKETYVMRSGVKLAIRRDDGRPLHRIGASVQRAQRFVQPT